MSSHSDWQKRHTKSVLCDTTITVLGINNSGDIPIQVHVKALELDYGPVIDIEVSSSAKFTNMIDWSDHPFMCSNEYMELNRVSNIIDDTPAIRALIEELVSPVKRKLYTSTDCTYKARLIKAVLTFWS